MTKQKPFSTAILVSIFSVFFLFCVWSVFSYITNSALILPSPKAVFLRLFELIQTKPFWVQLTNTLNRCASAFFISVFAAIFLGTCTALVPFADSFLRFIMTIIKSTPVVSFVLLAVFWFTSTAVPVFVSVLMTVPVLTSAIAAGINNTNKKLLEAAFVFDFSLWQKIRFIYFPSLLPYFFSGALSALGLTWKVIVAGEVLVLPKNSVGAALQTAKTHLETTDVFAWTIAVIILSYSIEVIFEQVTKKIRLQAKEANTL